MTGLALAIDASTYTASVALIQGDMVIREQTVPMRDRHRELLMPAIARALGDVEVRETERIVCGSGPGSFTSLRIAAAIAKGLAAAANKELFAVSSPLLLIAGTVVPAPAGRWLTLLDAMRGEYFAQLVDVMPSGEIIEASELRLVKEEDIATAVTTARARVAGPGRELDAVPHARGVARLTRHASLQTPVDLAAWEPDYGRLAEAQVRWEATHGRSLNAEL